MVLFCLSGLESYLCFSINLAAQDGVRVEKTGAFCSCKLLPTAIFNFLLLAPLPSQNCLEQQTQLKFKLQQHGSSSFFWWFDEFFACQGYESKWWIFFIGTATNSSILLLKYFFIFTWICCSLMWILNEIV